MHCRALSYPFGAQLTLTPPYTHQTSNSGQAVLCIHDNVNCWKCGGTFCIFCTCDSYGPPPGEGHTIHHVPEHAHEAHVVRRIQSRPQAVVGGWGACPNETCRAPLAALALPSIFRREVEYLVFGRTRDYKSKAIEGDVLLKEVDAALGKAKELQGKSAKKTEIILHFTHAINVLNTYFSLAVAKEERRDGPPAFLCARFIGEPRKQWIYAHTARASLEEGTGKLVVAMQGLFPAEATLSGSSAPSSSASSSSSSFSTAGAPSPASVAAAAAAAASAAATFKTGNQLMCCPVSLTAKRYRAGDQFKWHLSGADFESLFLLPETETAQFDGLQNCLGDCAWHDMRTRTRAEWFLKKGKDPVVDKAYHLWDALGRNEAGFLDHANKINHTDTFNTHQVNHGILKSGNIIIHDCGGGAILQMIDVFPSAQLAALYLSSCVDGKHRTEEAAPLCFKADAGRTRTLRYLVGNSCRGNVGLPFSCVVYSGYPPLKGYDGKPVPQNAINVLATIGGVFLKLFINGPGLTDEEHFCNYLMLAYASSCIVRAGYEWKRGRVPTIEGTKAPTAAQLTAARALAPTRSWPETCDVVQIEGLTSQAGRKLNGREGIVFGREDSTSGRAQIFVMPRYLDGHAWAHLGEQGARGGWQGRMGQP